MGVLIVQWFVFAYLRSGSASEGSQEPEVVVPQNGEVTFQPWGAIAAQTVLLERPEWAVMELEKGGIRQPWYFSGTQDELRGFFTDLPISPDHRGWLLDTGNWTSLNGEVSILPPADLVLSLSPSAREELAEKLREHPGNDQYTLPYVFPWHRKDEWFENSDLPATTVARLNQLVYRQNALACVSDVEVVLNEATTRERREIVRVLSRMPTVDAEVIIPHGASMADLRRYWERDTTFQKIVPLLQSMVRAPSGGRLDLMMLLPEFARDALYSYPDRTQDAEVGHKDCFWTAVRFHHPEVDGDTAFYDAKACLQFIDERYTRINSAPRFGDLLLLHDEESRKVSHACVYIAENVVFTKNGAAVNEPWVLMWLDDMLAYYSKDGPPAQLWLRSVDAS